MSGIGGGLFFGSRSNAVQRLRAVSGRRSPLRPIRFGVAAFPTHSPISKGHSPYRTGSSCRSSSSAQTKPAARPNWS